MLRRCLTRPLPNPPSPNFCTARLVLYERVISTKAEHELMDKLSKPKVSMLLAHVYGRLVRPCIGQRSGTRRWRSAA